MVYEAYALELPKYSVKVSITTYVAAWSTGLLCVCMLHNKIDINKIYEG